MQPCGINKHACIFLLRRTYYPLRFAFLDYTPFMKYAYPVTERGNKAHVVGNKENRNAKRFLQLLKQLEDACLNGYIKIARGLVRNKELRTAA